MHGREHAQHAAVQRVVLHGLPVRAVRDLLELAVLGNEARVAPAPVTAAVLEMLIGRQVRPVPGQDLELGGRRANPGRHTGGRQNGIPLAAQLGRGLVGEDIRG
ncbi:hypothetical protein D3C71_1694400 [compost metagenome]